MADTQTAPLLNVIGISDGGTSCSGRPCLVVPTQQVLPMMVPDGANVAEGSVSNAPFPGSGGATIISILKGIYANTKASNGNVVYMPEIREIRTTTHEIQYIKEGISVMNVLVLCLLVSTLTLWLSWLLRKNWWPFRSNKVLSKHLREERDKLDAELASWDKFRETENLAKQQAEFDKFKEKQEPAE